MAEEDTALADDQPYQALYRRYRPQRFADVRGQEHVTRALRNAVREGRVAHAYLFSGPRGTGKTSTARILAMALNCEAPEGGEPDGTCTSCVSIRTGSSMDVFELDAASNRRLEEMRDLLSRVALGTPGRWKVYIVDEVHQLTPDAASALLKTLEEPPSHVVFVLATTDPQKVLPTILSRTQHFEFRLLDGDLLTGLLNDINQDADLGLPPEAVRVAVQRGRGSARDAESALDQLAAAGSSEDDSSHLADLVDALAQRDTAATLQAVAGGISAGKDPRRLGSELVEYLRNAFLADQAPSLVLLPGTTTAKLAESANRLTLAFIVRAMETVGEALIDMRDSVDPRVTLEVALIRLASPSADVSPAALLERIERLERAIGEKGAAAGGPPDTSPTRLGVARAAPQEPGPAPPERQALALGATSVQTSAQPPESRSSEAHSSDPRAREAQARVAQAREAPSQGAQSQGTQLQRPQLQGPQSQGAQSSGRPSRDAPLPQGRRPGESSPPAAPPRGPALPAQPVQAQPVQAQPVQAQPVQAQPQPTQPAPGSGKPMIALGAILRGGGTAAVGSGTSSPAPEMADPPGPTPAKPPSNTAANDAGPSLPSRDELTKAWGDVVLDKLSRPAKVYMANGRFVEVSDGAAVFALPDPGLLSRARAYMSEAEKALSAQFGQRVPLRLVLDKGVTAAAEPSGPRPGDDDAYDLDDIADVADTAPLPDIPVEERILQAFPGSVVDG